MFQDQSADESCDVNGNLKTERNASSDLPSSTLEVQHEGEEEDDLKDILHGITLGVIININKHDSLLQQHPNMLNEIIAVSEGSKVERLDQEFPKLELEADNAGITEKRPTVNHRPEKRKCPTSSGSVDHLDKLVSTDVLSSLPVEAARETLGSQRSNSVASSPVTLMLNSSSTPALSYSLSHVDGSSNAAIAAVASPASGATQERQCTASLKASSSTQHTPTPSPSQTTTPTPLPLEPPLLDGMQTETYPDLMDETAEGSGSGSSCEPNEPRYCSCNEVSYGDMVGCDNDHCPMEWFHYFCVGLARAPKGKWYCPQCTVAMKRRGRKRRK